MSKNLLSKIIKKFPNSKKCKEAEEQYFLIEQRDEKWLEPINGLLNHLSFSLAETYSYEEVLKRY